MRGMALGEYLAGEVVEDYADALITRREALRRLCLLGLSVSSAGTLLAACGGDDVDRPTAAVTTTTTTTSLPGELVRFPGASGEVTGAFAAPEVARATVLVIHENEGLTPHFRDLVGRFAAEGYAALAVDLLSPEGGVQGGAAAAALSAAPLERLLGDSRAGIGELLRRFPDRDVGAVGFCFGGAMTWNLLHAGEARLAAAAPFYGPTPDAPDFRAARAAVLAVSAEHDDRVNVTRDRADAALRAAGLTYEVRTFPGTGHGFFNDTRPRHHPEAAAEAWQAVLQWFGTHLA
jgi:carboxymethylenebutenolidase